MFEFKQKSFPLDAETLRVLGLMKRELNNPSEIDDDNFVGPTVTRNIISRVVLGAVFLTSYLQFN